MRCLTDAELQAAIDVEADEAIVSHLASCSRCRNRAGVRRADTAMLLGRLFGMSAQTWMNLQTQYDLEIAENELGYKIDQEVMPIAA